MDEIKMHENIVCILKNDTSQKKKKNPTKNKPHQKNPTNLWMFGKEKRYIFQLSTLLLALAEMRRHNKSNHLCLNTKEEKSKSVSV